MSTVASQQYFQFGSGFAYAVPNAGSLATNPTPQRFATLQGVDVSFAKDIKELTGNRDVADSVATGYLKITGKITMGMLDVNQYNQLFFGKGTIDGSPAIIVPEELHAIAASVSVGHSPITDLGVFTGIGSQFVSVASSPAQGEYVVNPTTGAYSFNAADYSPAQNAHIDYAYTGSGDALNYSAQAIGTGPVVSLYLFEQFPNQEDITVMGKSLVLYAVRIHKLNVPRKKEDYEVVEMDFTAFQDAQGRVFAWGPV